MEENKTVQADEEMSAEAASRTESDGECVDEINEETCDGECDEKSSRGERKKLKKAEAQIAELEGELNEANDKYMRLYAEYENFRKRSQKEKEGTYADAYIDALTQILPILDNLERAAAYGTEDAEHPLAKGLELTLKSFEETMEKMGVKEIEALGAKFDPNLHNAVMHVDDDSFGESEVVEVFMKGYIRGDKVLRYSMVKVAN